MGFSEGNFPSVGRAKAVESRAAVIQTPGVIEGIFATLVLILTLPVLIAVAIAIKLESRGPVFFLQDRIGLSGRKFRIVKFRTMTVLENGNDVVQATRDDDRITRIGYFLRRMSLDEFPQFINVLKGDMAVVGPRPHAVAHDMAFSRSVPNYAFRQEVKPGITGWAQINGLRGETPDAASMDERVSYDLWYIENRSFTLDAWIVWKTIGVALRQVNAY